jgi:hypothetical protein
MDLVGYAIFRNQNEFCLEEFDQYITNYLDNGQSRYIDYSDFSDFSSTYILLPTKKYMLLYTESLMTFNHIRF